MSYTTSTASEDLTIRLIVASLFTAVTTTIAIALVAEQQLSLIAIFAGSLFNVIGGGILALIGYQLPTWVWIFFIVSWITPFILAIESPLGILASILTSVISGIVAAGGYLFGGWSSELAIDTFIAAISPLSAGLSMPFNDPFSFTAPQLGIVVILWLVSVVIELTADEDL